MVQERPLTPEKQLLNLIENPKQKGASAIGLHAIRHRGLSLLSPHAWLGRISFSRDWFRKWFSGPGRQLDIKIINKSLGLGTALIAAYFITNVLSSLLYLRKMPEIKPESQKTGAGAASRDASLLKNTVSYYLEQVRQRDIFRMGPKKTEGAPEAQAPAGPSAEIIEATQHFKLVGISWSNDPDAMIEDTKALKTFFVKRGQMLGDVRVQAIFKDKVILQYRGEEIELR